MQSTWLICDKMVVLLTRDPDWISKEARYLKISPLRVLVQVAVCYDDGSSIYPLCQALVVLHELVCFINSEELEKGKIEMRSKTCSKNWQSKVLLLKHFPIPDCHPFCDKAQSRHCHHWCGPCCRCSNWSHTHGSIERKSDWIMTNSTTYTVYHFNQLHCLISYIYSPLPIRHSLEAVGNVEGCHRQSLPWTTWSSCSDAPLWTFSSCWCPRRPAWESQADWRRNSPYTHPTTPPPPAHSSTYSQ